MPAGKILAPVLLVGAASGLLAQAPSPRPAAGPAFEVVSIKPSAPVVYRDGYTSGITERPGGGLIGKNVLVSMLIARAYPPMIPLDIRGLPEWATRDRYDVSATSSLRDPTQDARAAMLRGMLADRFKLVVHTEQRPQPVYDLVLARRDGRLGPGLTPRDIDCAQVLADRAAAGPPPAPPAPSDYSAPPPQCTLRVVGATLRDRSGDGQGRLGDLLEGETTLDNLAGMLRMSAGRLVVNKTGLTGSYRVAMNFDMSSGRRGPDPGSPTPGGAASVFTAVQEQLGLRLEAANDPGDTLVVDRLERPTED